MLASPQVSRRVIYSSLSTTAVRVGKRQLDLFRVTSHRGQVELHFLGHRILLPLLKRGGLE